MRHTLSGFIIVQYKDRQETFRKGRHYVTVGAARLQKKLRVGIVSWLAYAAFANGLTFENPTAAPRLLSAQPSRHSANKLISVSFKDRRETFREGETYSVRVGVARLPDNVSAAIASWLAYVAFANDLPFEKSA